MSLFDKAKKAVKGLAADAAMALGGLSPAPPSTETLQTPRAERQIKKALPTGLQLRNGRVVVTTVTEEGTWQWQPSGQVVLDEFAAALSDDAACDRFVANTRDVREEMTLIQDTAPVRARGGGLTTNGSGEVLVQNPQGLQSWVSRETFDVQQRQIQRLEEEVRGLRRERLKREAEEDAKKVKVAEPDVPDNRPDRAILVD